LVVETQVVKETEIVSSSNRHSSAYRGPAPAMVDIWFNTNIPDITGMDV
jgi:hypothetical protein